MPLAALLLLPGLKGSDSVQGALPLTHPLTWGWLRRPGDVLGPSSSSSELAGCR